MKIVTTTEEMSRRFCADMGLNCPVCGADLDQEGQFGSIDIEQPIVFQQVHCLACGSTFTQKFELYEIDEIDLGPDYSWDDPKEEDPYDRTERPDRAA